MLLLRKRNPIALPPLGKKLSLSLQRPTQMITNFPTLKLPIGSHLIRCFETCLCFLNSQVECVTAACTEFVSGCREQYNNYYVRRADMFLMCRKLYCPFVAFPLISLLPIVGADEHQCGCGDDKNFWSWKVTIILQELSGYLTAFAHYSIPLTFIWYMTPYNQATTFKSYFLFFIFTTYFFGTTHMLTARPLYQHPFETALALIILKISTTLLLFSTRGAITKFVLLLLKSMTSCIRLNERVRNLCMEMDTTRQSNELNSLLWKANREIRRSLDKDTILRTSLVQLANALVLEDCMVWLLDEHNRNMVLTHTLRDDHSGPVHISSFDTDLRAIRVDRKAKILAPTSALGFASIGMESEVRSVAAVRIILPLISDSSLSMPVSIPTSFGVLIVVLPQTHGRVWRYQELEFVEMVSEQITVALSHAAQVEHSEKSRVKLAKRNQLLHQAREKVENANNSLKSFQKVWRHQVVIQLQSISGNLSILQQEQIGVQQRIMVSSILKASSVMSTLIYENERLNIRTFQLQPMINEAICLTRCLSIFQGLCFESKVKKSLPNWVRCDERRVFREMMSKIGILLSRSSPGATLYMNVISSSSDDSKVSIKFEIGLTKDDHLNNSVAYELELIESVHSCDITRLSEQPSFVSLLRGLRVALVDRDNRRVMHMLLERCGCKVTSVSSGMECLEVLGIECPFDVVVLELDLRDMNGFIVTHIVRQFQSRSRLLIVALTSDRSDEVLERCWEVGMNGVICRPVQLNEIAIGLHQVLENSEYNM